MWDPPAWWSWLWAATAVVLLTTRLLAARRRRRAHRSAAAARTSTARTTAARASATSTAGRGNQSPARPTPRLASVSWRPAPEPMGPVSGWPHALDAPDVQPSGSPEDRPDLAYS